jgi:predicted ester cyclase
MGIPASGRTVEIQAIDIVQFTDGIATAHWGVTDMAGMLMQLGAIPEPG